MYKISKAYKEDVADVYELCRNPALINPSGEPPKLWWIKEFIDRDQVFYVAKNGDDVIGFILGEELIAKVGYLWMMAVKEEYRNKGIGKELFLLAQGDFRKRKCKVLVGYAFEENDFMKDILEKEGYEKGGLYREYIKFLI